jgi:hypothetical protein
MAWVRVVILALAPAALGLRPRAALAHGALGGALLGAVVGAVVDEARREP